MARVIAIPDFFVDIVMHPSFDLNGLLEAMRETARLGGGNVRVSTVMRPGGNAGNSARVLAALGRRTTFGVTGSQLLYKLATLMMPGEVEVRYLGGRGECISSIIEVWTGSRLANIMLSDKSCLKPIGVEEGVTGTLARLVEEGWDACLAVNIAAWGNPAKAAKAVQWEKCRILLLDTSDTRGRRYGELLEALRLMHGSELTIISLNEGELAYHALHLGAGSPRETLEKLAEATGSIACLHTPHQALCEPGDIAQHNIFYTDNPTTATGAGDAWNAGLIDALLAGAELREALLHAHRVASCYVTKGAPCTRTQLPGADTTR